MATKAKRHISEIGVIKIPDSVAFSKVHQTELTQAHQGCTRNQHPYMSPCPGPAEFIEAVRKRAEGFAFQRHEEESHETQRETKDNLEAIEYHLGEALKRLWYGQRSRALLESVFLSEDQFADGVETMTAASGQWDGPVSFRGVKALRMAEKMIKYVHLAAKKALSRLPERGKEGRPRGWAVQNLCREIWALLLYHGIKPTDNETGPFVKTLSVAYSATGQDNEGAKEIRTIARTFLNSIKAANRSEALQVSTRKAQR